MCSSRSDTYLLQGAAPFRASSESNAPVRKAVSWSTSSCSPARCLWSTLCAFEVAGAGASRRTEVARVARVATLDHTARHAFGPRLARCGRCRRRLTTRCEAVAHRLPSLVGRRLGIVIVWRFQAALNAFWVAGPMTRAVGSSSAARSATGALWTSENASGVARRVGSRPPD